MDFVRLARLFARARPMGLFILQHLDPCRARWAGGREGLMRPLWAPFSSSSSQLPLGQERQENTGSLGSDPSHSNSTATQEEDEEQEESFGTLSNKYSSRKLFRKSAAQFHNLRFGERRDEQMEPEPKLWRGRRNTPYWYFLQCKRLIKEGKVRGTLGSVAPGFFPLAAQCFARGHLTFPASKFWAYPVELPALWL